MFPSENRELKKVALFLVGLILLYAAGHFMPKPHRAEAVEKRVIEFVE